MDVALVELNVEPTLELTSRWELGGKFWSNSWSEADSGRRLLGTSHSTPGRAGPAEANASASHLDIAGVIAVT
jgi:hypothetical protein